MPCYEACIWFPQQNDVLNPVKNSFPNTFAIQTEQKKLTQDVSQTSKTIMEHLESIDKPFFYFSINATPCIVFYNMLHQRKMGRRNT